MECKPIILLNNDCNFKCCHCYVKKDNRELPVSKVIDFYNNVIKPNDVTFLRIAGGEPFLYSQFPQLTDFLITLDGIDINFTTNGSIIKEDVIESLQKIRPKLVKVSLLSLREDTYKAINGVDFPLDKVLENITIFANMFDIGINMTIMRNTIQDIGPLIDFCLKNGIKNLFFSQLTRSGSGLDVADQKLSNNEIKEIHDIVSRVDKRILDIRYDDDCHCAFNEDFVLSWDGNVFPCCALTSYPEYRVGTSDSNIAIMRENIKKMNSRRTKKCFVEEFIH